MRHGTAHLADPGRQVLTFDDGGVDPMLVGLAGPIDPSHRADEPFRARLVPWRVGLVLLLFCSGIFGFFTPARAQGLTIAAVMPLIHLIREVEKRVPRGARADAA